MTQDELTALARKWQQRLRLQDWDVTVEIKRAREMSLDGKAGEVVMVLEQRRAWITLRDMTDVDPEEQADNDPEVTVVHELLHLFTEPLGLPEEGPRATAEEQMLNAVSRALVALDRERH